MQRVPSCREHPHFVATQGGDQFGNTLVLICWVGLGGDK